MGLKAFYNPIVHDIPLLRVLYDLSSLLVPWLAKLRLTPNQVTHLSNAVAVGSLYPLYHGHGLAFAILSFLSLILDICDGTLARFTKQFSRFGSLYDHISDMGKIVLILTVVGVREQSELTWLLIAGCLSGFILYQSLNERLPAPDLPASTKQAADKSQSAGPVRLSWFFSIHNSLFLISGNFMLYFLVLGFPQWSNFGLASIGFVIFYGAARILRILLKVL